MPIVEVITVEGLAGGRREAAARCMQAFVASMPSSAASTRGQLVSATACVAEGRASDEATVREWMSGNICRCSWYPQITAAVLAAAGATR